jgi:hypothetical protein
MFKPNRFVSITAPKVTYAEPPEPYTEPDLDNFGATPEVPERSNSRFPGEKLLKKLNKVKLPHDGSDAVAVKQLNVKQLETALGRLLREW